MQGVKPRVKRSRAIHPPFPSQTIHDPAPFGTPTASAMPDTAFLASPTLSDVMHALGQLRNAVHSLQQQNTYIVQCLNTMNQQLTDNDKSIKTELDHMYKHLWCTYCQALYAAFGTDFLIDSDSNVHLGPFWENYPTS